MQHCTQVLPATGPDAKRRWYVEVSRLNVFDFPSLMVFVMFATREKEHTMNPSLDETLHFDTPYIKQRYMIKTSNL